MDSTWLHFKSYSVDCSSFMKSQNRFYIEKINSQKIVAIQQLIRNMRCQWFGSNPFLVTLSLQCINFKNYELLTIPQIVCFVFAIITAWFLAEQFIADFLCKKRDIEERQTPVNTRARTLIHLSDPSAQSITFLKRCCTHFSTKFYSGECQIIFNQTVVTFVTAL